MSNLLSFYLYSVSYILDLPSHESLKTSLVDALSKTDIVVTTGGVSMGEKV